EPVVGWARVARVRGDVPFLEGGGGQRVALDVVEVLNEGRHQVARATGRHGGGALEAVGEGQEGDHEGHEPDRHKEPAPGDGSDDGSGQAPPRHPQEEEVEERKGDPEPPDPLRGRANPAVRRGHTVFRCPERDGAQKGDDRGYRGPRPQRVTWRRGSSSASLRRCASLWAWPSRSSGTCRRR